MSVAVELPALGESIVEGTVSRWLVKEGDRVELDQPLVEVTTDKVDAELPSPVAGVIEKILVAEGEVVEVGAQLVLIDPSGSAAATRPLPAQAARESAKSPREPAPAAPATAAASEIRATPLARRMAEQSGVDLDRVQATGVGGSVSRDDVERAGQPAPKQRDETSPKQRDETSPKRRDETSPKRRDETSPKRRATKSPTGAPKRPAYLDYQLQPGDKVTPMSPLRRLVAEHMVLSKRVSPHVGTVAEIDMGAVVKLRSAQKQAFQEAHGFALSYLPFILYATVRALREYPILNASVLEDAIVQKQDIHVGIAVETEKGLIVPVVRHADRLSLAGLAQAVEDLARRARSKKLSPDDLKGGTFTISNPGRHGNLYGFAIINQPQVGILRMGEIVKRPVVREIDGEDALVIRPILHLALSYDHRAVDGAPANGFLHRVGRLLEEAEFDL